MQEGRGRRADRTLPGLRGENTACKEAAHTDRIKRRLMTASSGETFSITHSSRTQITGGVKRRVNCIADKGTKDSLMQEESQDIAIRRGRSCQAFCGCCCWSWRFLCSSVLTSTTRSSSLLMTLSRLDSNALLSSSSFCSVSLSTVVCEVEVEPSCCVVVRYACERIGGDDFSEKVV